MVYTLVRFRAAGLGPVTAMPGMASTAPAANPAVSLVSALFMLGYIMWTADRLPARESEASSAAGRTAGAALAPRAAAYSEIAMSLAMGYMLLTML